MCKGRVYHFVVPVAGALLAVLPSSAVLGQSAVPTATLSAAATPELTGDVDPNSPVVWESVDGEPRLYVMTSTAGAPSVSTGPRLAPFGAPTQVGFVSHPGQCVWMEAVIRDEMGTWHGYYHNEIPADLCGRPDQVLPRIGAARSGDQGATSEDLGIMLEAPLGWHACDTPNRYFVDGLGDVSVVLDRDGQDLYFFFSQYSAAPQAQGVAVARMLWADRDAPVGRIDVSADGVWQPPTQAIDIPGEITWQHRAGTPLVPVTRPWHDAYPVNDAFWGAAVHWNEYLEQYVMLLNRTKDAQFGQEGIYAVFAPTLDDPSLWSRPERLLARGSWYPQVIGLDRAEGTDKEAGARTRFLMGGVSNYIIRFAGSSQSAEPR